MKITDTIELNSGHAMPRFGLGVWQASDAQARAAVAFALENGYRMVDTAEEYGNERGVGQGIRDSGLPREEVFVTTKYWPRGGGYPAARAAFDESYRRLGLEYVDLFLIHWPPQPRSEFLDTWRAFEDLLQDGRLRSIGVSNFAIPHLQLLAEAARVPPAVDQVELHPDMQQRGLVDYCNRHGIATESWSPLGGSSRHDHSLLQNEVIGAIAEKHGKSPAQVIIRWHLQAGHIVIPKSIHSQRIVENSQVFDFALNRQDLDAIEQLDDPANRVGPDPAEAQV